MRLQADASNGGARISRCIHDRFAVEQTMQQNACLVPLASHRAFRYRPEVCDRQSARGPELEIHAFGEPRLDLRDRFERFIERAEIDVLSAAADTSVTSDVMNSPPRFCAWRRRT